ncbi:unnamed protein product [Ectocarpus sp. 12 AP-2014]
MCTAKSTEGRLPLAKNKDKRSGHLQNNKFFLMSNLKSTRSSNGRSNVDDDDGVTASGAFGATLDVTSHDSSAYIRVSKI